MAKDNPELFPDTDIKRWAPKNSDVKPDTRRGTISVSNNIDSNRIPLKIIAPYDKWIEWEEVYLSQGCIDISIIENFITKRIPIRIIPKLIEYCHNHLQKFSHEFYEYYIFPANMDNPKSIPWGIKARGGSPLIIEKSEKARINYNATFLYVFIADWAKIKESDRPEQLKDLGINSKKIKPKEKTKEIIERWYPSYSIESMDTEQFYEHFILAWRNLSQIKAIVRRRKQWMSEWPTHLPWLPYPPPALEDLYKKANIPAHLYSKK